MYKQSVQQFSPVTIKYINLNKANKNKIYLATIAYYIQ